MLGLGLSLTKAATVLVSGEGGASQMPAANLLSVRSTDDTVLDAFEAWLGNSAGAVMAFCDGDSWANIVARPDSIAGDYVGHPGIRKDWAIPLASNTQDIAATIAGTHDSDITTLAENILANDDHDDIWIRLGWEFNLTNYPWADGNATTTQYIDAYQRVVGLFRAVSDKFRFGWIPNWGGSSDPEDWYPGDDYVDYVGMNMYFKTVFDQNTGQTGSEVWTNKRSGATYSLDYIASFASTHNKRLAIPEWGCDADEPAIVVGMAEYVSDNAANFLYHGYWDQDTPVVTKLSENQFPLCAQAYIYHFGTSVEWTPASYFGADLYDWFDAQDESTITLNGSGVSNWESKVGSGRSAAQGSAANQPEYSATARNGLPGINSDGTSDYLVQTSVSGVPAGQAAFTWAVQAYGDPSLATGFKYFLAETVENTASTSSRALGSGNGSTRFQASGTLSTGQLHSNDRSIVCTAAAGANQAMKLSIDGLASATGSPAVGSFTVSRATLFAGGGASGTFGGYSDVILQEVIKVNREVTDDEIDMLHGYLAHRWGRVSALDVDHPYKGNPPVNFSTATVSQSLGDFTQTVAAVVEDVETANLLLDSNGWTGVSINPATVTSDDNTDQYFEGGDFDNALWSTETFWKWWCLFITGNNNGSPITATYGGPSFETVTGRGGGSVTALQFQILAKPPSTGVAQIRLTDYQSSGTSGTEPVFYQRMWVKFDENILARAQRVGSTDFYHILWEPKCEPDYRMRIQLQYNGTKLYWVAHDDVLTNANHIHTGTNSTVDVVLAPKNSSSGWHKIEVYVDRPNGIWRAAVDGSDIINLNFGAGTDLYGASGNIMNFPMHLQMYSTVSLPFSGDGPMYMLTEDLEIWDSPPNDAWT